LVNNTAVIGTFPFGSLVQKVTQKELTPKPVFVLGVYGSSVLAQFKPHDSKNSIRYLPVDNEPEIFWSGGQENVRKIITKINVPKIAGKLTPELSTANGILGRSFDKYYLHPMKLQRSNVWICNLIPHVVINKNERKAIKKYNDVHSMYNFLKAELPTKKERWNFISKNRFQEIVQEILQSKAEVLISLGQQPLKWFLQEYDQSVGNLLNVKDYGSMHDIRIGSAKIKLIPLYHPRQLLKEKNRDTKIGLFHYDWLKNKAKKIKLL
jgi:hypothetical protein